MSVADIILSLIIWIFQKLILPILPTNLPALSFVSFNALLEGSLKHNLIYSFAGLNEILNIKLVFILMGSIVFAEIIMWLVKAGFFLVKLIRG